MLRVCSVARDQRVFETDLCVAADGASSSIRKQFNIGVTGQEALQHLVNDYVQVLLHQAAQLLHTNNKNQAMTLSKFPAGA
jgi:2-polyprenyl-6-methoxyphenol hydroxylase-like FAD-dependent oxidoreductase